jgi:hypothetical protein
MRIPFNNYHSMRRFPIPSRHNPSNGVRNTFLSGEPTKYISKSEKISKAEILNMYINCHIKLLLQKKNSFDRS